MGFYARPSARLARQVAVDVFVVGWAATWWCVGRIVDANIRVLAEPARVTAQVSADLRRQVGDAATQAGGVPVVGDGLRQPFDGMGQSLQQLAASAADQVRGIEQTALVLGWLAFVIPVALMVAVWLPSRLRFARRSAAAEELARRPGGDDLLALRALATLPLADLTAISPDTAAAWRARDREVVRRLADLELASVGVRRRRVRD